MESSPENNVTKNRKRFNPGAVIFMAMGICAVVFLFQMPDFGPSRFLERVMWPLARLMGIIAFTLGISAVVEGMGWSSMVAGFSRPLMRTGNLSDRSGAAFTAAFLSGVSANTMLWNAYQEKHITKRELIISNLLNLGLPSFTIHLPTTLAIIVPLVGRAGLIYISVMFGAALIRTLIVLSAGRVLLAPPGAACGPEIGCAAEQELKTPRSKRVKRLLKTYLSGRLTLIATYTVPIYISVIALQKGGFFHWLQLKSTGLITSEIMPVEGISVVVFSIMAEFTAGVAAAGAMLEEGVLSLKQTVLALLLGNILATPVRALRHQLPRYLGIFQPSLGIQLIIMGQLLRITSVVLAGSVLCLIF